MKNPAGKLQAERRLRILGLALACAFVALTPARSEEISPTQGEELFSRVDSMLADVREIMTFGARRPIRRSLLTKQEINNLITRRLKQETRPEEIRREELFLRLFGFVPHDFDLKKALVDVMTEQATALYDYKTRQLYMATWTPKDMQEFSLVHELAHAVADQNFGLKKYVKKADDSDQDLARSAVIEGQASWVMTEWVMRQGGKSLVDNRLLAIASASASRIEAKEYPVYASAPLYVRETLLFPYTDGLMFQQTMIEEFGESGFAKVFEQPPLSTQHILQPDLYLQGLKPLPAALPRFKKPKGYKKIYEGVFGQFEHEVLLKQHLGADETYPIVKQWRGGAYEVFENRRDRQAALVYSSRWADEQAAEQFLDLYRKICRNKWDGLEVEHETATSIAGRYAGGRFQITRRGRLVQSIEGPRLQ